MKKSSKPILFYLLVLLLTIVSFFISITMLKISYEQMLMKKDKAEKELIFAVQEQKKLNVIYQDLTSEDYIIPYAKKNLNMIRNLNESLTIKISKTQINELKEHINRKYE
jgi:hypothetical protein